MDSNNSGKKFLGLIAAVLVAGLLLGVAISAPSARANAITDFFTNLFAPPSSSSSQAVPGINGANNGAGAVPSLYQPAVNYEQAVINAVKQASPAVVSIIISEQVPVVEQCPYNPFGDIPPEFQQFFGNGGTGFTQPCDTGKTQLQQVGGGSGFIISPDGLILTNKHVVSNTGASYTVITEDGTKYDATVLARDPNQDLAVVKIKANNLPTVSLGDSDSLQLGQTAIAIGNALGEFSNTVSVGVVSGLARTVTASAPDTGAQETISNVIQTDAAINPGNSGGPLLNLAGQVIGINTAVASNAQNIGFAIPINTAKHDIASVEATGAIQTPYLGVRYLTVTPAIAQQQNLAVSEGALVRGSGTGAAVQPNSPAAKAGIQAEDIIVKVDNQQLDANHTLSDIISQYNVGDTITIVVNRAGKDVTLQATLAQRPANQ